MAVYRYSVSIRKNDEGRFGFAFDALRGGSYEISKVADWVTQDLRYGDVLKSVNDVTSDLEQYCRSAEALALSEWLLIIERPSLPQLSLCSQTIPTTLRPHSPDDSSLDFSLISGNGPTLQELAVDKPTQIIWSDPFDVMYINAAHIDTHNLRFKKKETRKVPKEEWILLVKIMHTAAYPYTYLSPTNMLQPGDWMLKVNGSSIPFYCEEGTTTWFRNQLLSLSNQAITITVRRPLTSIADTMEDRVSSVISVLPSFPMTNPRQLPLSDPSPNRHLSDISKHSGVGVAAPPLSGLSDGPQELTDNPEELRRGKNILDTYRRSIQLTPIEKLGRCRLIFHHASLHSVELTEHVQSEIFRHGYASQVDAIGGYIKEYHVHTILTEEDSGITFSQPTNEDCISLESSTCSFEMHETISRISEKTALSPLDRKSLLDLPDHVSSGPVSIGSLKRRTHTPEVFNANKMHLEVLSLTGPMAAKYNNWCSPIVYCKYSINVVVTDVKALLTAHLDTQLSRTLCDINAHSGRDVLATTECVDHAIAGSRVLLVVMDSDSYDPPKLREMIEHRLQFYLPMLVVTDDCWPFILGSRVGEIPQLLSRELRHMSASASMDNIQHAGVMLSQQLKNVSMEISDLDGLKERLRESIVLQADSDLSTWQTVADGTFKYLHNIGLAYIPELSYSASIGRECVDVRNTSLIHPHRLVSTIDRLMQRVERYRGVASDSTWTHLIASNHAFKLLGMLKDVHVILPVYNTENADSQKTVLPLAHFNPIGQQPPDGDPALLLKYKNGLNFLLVTAFLNCLSSQSVSSNLDYHFSCGIFHIFHHTVQVYRTTNTRFGWRSQQPIAITDQSLSFFVSSTSPEKMSTIGFTTNLKKLITDFHSTPSMAKDKPMFGPPCPLEERCSNGPFHVIDTLGNATLSCSGISLERINVVKDYVCDERLNNVPDINIRRMTILSRPANQLPLRLVEQLDEHNPLQRNWIGLARLENLSPPDIDKLEETDSPANSLLTELSLHRGYTIENLFKRLVTDMEMDLLAKAINDWIDLECIN